MNIFTLGNGFIANHLPYSKITARLTPNIEQIKSALDPYNVDILINCIGFCGEKGGNIDSCESFKEKTFRENTTIPLLLADYCAYNNIYLIHISSGCIFSGQSSNVSYNNEGYFSSDIDYGWTETDVANPKSYYSKTKYATDLVFESLSNVTSLRIRMPISEQDNQRNLINKLKKYNKIIDIPNSVTFTNDLVRCVDFFVKNKIPGIFHATNPEPLTAARIMREYQKYVPEHQFEIITEQQLDAITIAKRSNCLLSTNKINKLGFTFTNSEEALYYCMKQYINNLRK